MPKHTTLVFGKQGSKEAQALCESLRTKNNLVLMRAATPHLYDAETNDRVIVMSDVDDASKRTIKSLFANVCESDSLVSKDASLDEVKSFVAGRAPRSRNRVLA